MEDEFIASYVLQPDASLNTNIMIKNGHWVNEESQETLANEGGNNND